MRNSLYFWITLIMIFIIFFLVGYIMSQNVKIQDLKNQIYQQERVRCASVRVENALYDYIHELENTMPQGYGYLEKPKELEIYIIECKGVN